MGEYHLFFLNNCIYPDIVQNYVFIEKKKYIYMCVCVCALRAYVSTAGRHWGHCSEKDTVLNTSERTVLPSSHHSVRKPGIILHSFPPIFLEMVTKICLSYPFFCVYPLWGTLIAFVQDPITSYQNLCSKLQTRHPASNLTSLQSIPQTAPSVPSKPPKGIMTFP